jgi:DNA-binding transcriptional LysR family regulator
MNLDDLTDFALVAANGGFAQASRVSGRPKASLSRKIMDLEAALGVRLFERSPRSVRLTEEGALLFERTSGPLNEIVEVADVLRDGRTKPHGQLRVNVPTLFGHMLMGRLAAEFALAYPDVKLAVTMEDRAVDLVNEGYDVVIRVNPEPNSDLVGRCFVRDHVLVVSVPSVAEQFSIAEITGERPLPVVGRSSTSSPRVWQIPGPPVREIYIQPILELPSLTMVRDAVLTGIGAAKLPRLLVAADLAAGRLVSWGPSSDRPSELWVLHASRRLASAKIKAFIQFLDASFPDEWI